MVPDFDDILLVASLWRGVCDSPSLSSSSLPPPSSSHLCQHTSSARGGLLPGNRPECMIKTLISNLSPGRLMWLISSDAPRSSCGGPEHSGFTHAKLIFTVKWDIWFRGRRPASSSNSSSNASRIFQNCTYLSFFFCPLACFPRIVPICHGTG